jgi:hypothetical protein
VSMDDTDDNIFNLVITGFVGKRVEETLTCQKEH